MKNENLFIFSQDNIKATRDTFNKSFSLPPECYIDPLFFAYEKQHIFHKNWLCVGRVNQIPNIGDYFTIDLLNDPLVVVRDKKNVIRVLSRVCRHRWMILVEGTGNANHFQCPYHGWMYDLAGNLKGAPDMERTDYDKNLCTLPSLLTEIWQGFIFVNYDTNAESLSSQLSALNLKLEGYQISEMKSIAPITYESDWNWKVMFENASEVYHLGLHKNTLVSSLPTKLSIIEDNDGPYTFYRIPNKNRAPLPTAFEPRNTLNAEQLSEFVLCSVFPCHIMVINPDQMTWIQIVPKSVNSHTLHFHLCFNPSAFSDPKFYQKCKQSKWFLEQIHAEDIFACKNVQKGLASSLARPTQFSYLEKTIWQFHNWILNQLKVD